MAYIGAQNGFFINTDHITHFQIKQSTGEVFVVGEIGPFIIEENQVHHLLRLIQNTASRDAKK